MAKQGYSVIGGLNENLADDDSRPMEFSVLINARPDKKIGALVKRPGSTSEAIGAGLGIPIGMGEFLTAASTSLIPITRSLLVNFGGSAFRKYAANAWSSVTIDPNCSFGSVRRSSFAMLHHLFVAGGRPAVWFGGSEDLERVGVPAPVAAITGVAAGAGITGTFRYMWTYYRSTDGLESDWSPLSASIVAANDTITLTIPTTPASAKGINQKRIYRTLDGGSIFYLLTTVSLATSVFADAIPDASLVTPSAELGELGLPPDSSYINEAFASHMWWVDDADPYTLVFSKPYIGNRIHLQYYPDDNFLSFNQPITGLINTGRRLLVFHPKGISMITGFSKADFTATIVHNGVGTLFHGSISSNGETVIFLSEQGWSKLSGDGVVLISRSIDSKLQPILATAYNNDLYVSSTWNNALREFVMMISAASAAGAPWSTVGSGALAEWQVVGSGALAEWQDTVAPGTEETRRIALWGWSEEANLWAEYKFAQAVDLNEDGAFTTFLFTPLPSSDILVPQQERTYMGFFDGAEGDVISLFKRGVAMDDADPVEAIAITGRVSPGNPDNFKRVLFIEMEGAYADPTADGDGEIRYLKEFDDPQDRDYSAELLDFTGAGDKKVPEQGLMRYMRMYFRDTSAVAEKILVQKFKVHYVERDYRESR